MERFDCLSTTLYYRVNEIIGDRELVSIRRDVSDLSDTFNNSSNAFGRVMHSGSRREGFDMIGSDADLMMWFSNIYVICDTTQSHYYNTTTHTLILAEHGLTRPGFVLLRLLHVHQVPTMHKLILLPSYLSLHNHTYISSSRHRQFYSESFRSFPNFDLHGPCVSGIIDGNECDLAICFQCLHWPPQAFSWLQRCQRKCWPRPSVLHDITHSGCHFVAIGAKQSIFENVEWRLSFSQAEQKLIYSFNHCQLLVYGLLKLFLKEVLNSGIPENQKLLCSYFMKTALFWQIQADISIHWSVDTFLFCFWNCFKLLIKWVTCEYCPNFFVPENNMFFPKIIGSDQQRLLSQLLDLYNEGVACLLRCASIQDKFIFAIFCPHHTLNVYEIHSSEMKKDIALKECCTAMGFMNSYIYEDHIFKYIHFYRMKFRSNISKARRLFFYSKIIHHCQRFALFHQMNHIHNRENLEMYTMKKQSLILLKQTSRLGFLTDVIYLALYYYINGRYTQTLCLLQEIKQKLYRPYLLYTPFTGHIYIQAMGGKSLSTKIKEAFANDIFIPDFVNVPELRLELTLLKQFYRLIHQCSGGAEQPEYSFNPNSFLMVSPFVFVHFLLFLCHHYLGSVEHRQQALHDLHTLLHNEQDSIHKYTPVAAWQLLGICYQINQNPQQALQCYKKAFTFLKEDNQYLPLTIATHYRIKSVERQLIQQYIIEPPLD